MLIKEIFNESIWADLKKGTTIGSSSLRNRHSIRVVHTHLESRFNKHRPVDIQSIMDRFILEVDTSKPLEKYFERQQQCQHLLGDTTLFFLKNRKRANNFTAIKFAGTKFR
jgi:hypothetical protein